MLKSERGFNPLSHSPPATPSASPRRLHRLISESFMVEPPLSKILDPPLEIYSSIIPVEKDHPSGVVSGIHVNDCLIYASTRDVFVIREQDRAFRRSSPVVLLIFFLMSLQAECALSPSALVTESS